MRLSATNKVDIQLDIVCADFSSVHFMSMLRTRIGIAIACLPSSYSHVSERIPYKIQMMGFTALHYYQMFHTIRMMMMRILCFPEIKRVEVVHVWLDLSVSKCVCVCPCACFIFLMVKHLHLNVNFIAIEIICLDWFLNEWCRYVNPFSSCSVKILFRQFVLYVWWNVKQQKFTLYLHTNTKYTRSAYKSCSYRIYMNCKL